MTESWKTETIDLRQSFYNGGRQASYDEEFRKCIDAFWEWVKAGCQNQQ